MAEQESEEQPSSGSLSEIVVALFKHKLKIIACGSLGVVLAILVFVGSEPLYKSEAKLFVPYVVDRSPVDAIGDATATSRANDAIINSEVEILRSWDLTFGTALSMGYNGVTSRTDSGSADVVRGIAKSIEVTTAKGMNVITVSYCDRDPYIATRFLEVMVKNYREKHLSVHRFPQALDVIIQRRDEVRRQLDLTELDLKALQEQLQSVSLKETATELTAAVTASQEAFNKAEAERRGQEARIEALEKSIIGNPGVAEKAVKPSPRENKADEYRSILESLAHLRERERSMLAIYPPDSRFVKIPRRQISELEAQRRTLEARYPGIAGVSAKEDSELPSTILSEKARLEAMKASEETLRAQFQEQLKKRERFADLAPRIARLELEKQLLEENYKNIEASLGKAKDDKAVDWSKISNIASIQEPSPAVKVANPVRKKIAPGLALGGLLLGVGIALLKEKILDRTIKSSSELQGRLRIPVLLSIPHFRTDERGGGETLYLEEGSDRESSDDPASNLTPRAIDQSIQPYCQAIRDRMILMFELQNLTHKPKLVGITGFSKGAGCSTLAGGLAAALSETGEGKVLLVNLNITDGDVHPFFHGKAVPLASLLKPTDPVRSVEDNLYLATVETARTRCGGIGLRRLNSLIPSLKAADFDYIIFDMPPLDPTSPSLGIASLMDKVLLVIEAERNERETVRRLYSELVETRSDVSCVFNKARSYAPKWIAGEN